MEGANGADIVSNTEPAIKDIDAEYDMLEEEEEFTYSSESSYSDDAPSLDDPYTAINAFVCGVVNGSGMYKIDEEPKNDIDEPTVRHEFSEYDAMFNVWKLVPSSYPLKWVLDVLRSFIKFDNEYNISGTMLRVEQLVTFLSTTKYFNTFNRLLCFEFIVDTALPKPAIDNNALVPIINVIFNDAIMDSPRYSRNVIYIIDHAPETSRDWLCKTILDSVTHMDPNEEYNAHLMIVLSRRCNVSIGSIEQRWIECQQDSKYTNMINVFIVLYHDGDLVRLNIQFSTDTIKIAIAQALNSKHSNITYFKCSVCAAVYLISDVTLEPITELVVALIDNIITTFNTLPKMHKRDVCVMLKTLTTAMPTHMVKQEHKDFLQIRHDDNSTDIR